MKTLIALLFALLITVIAQAQEVTPEPTEQAPFIRYVCSTNAVDIYEFYAPEGSDTLVYAYNSVSAHNYGFATGQYSGFYFAALNPDSLENTIMGFLWVGGDMYSAELPEESAMCAEDDTPVENNLPPEGIECGFVYERLAGGVFFVDGLEYTVNDSGMISWVVQKDAVWSWLFVDADGVPFALLTADMGFCELFQ